MAIKIPVRLGSGYLAVLQYLTLDGVRFGLECRYSVIAEGWHAWLRQPNGTLIAGPIGLVAGVTDLLAPFHWSPYVPPGRLYIVGEDPTVDTMDISALLAYEEIE